MKQRLSGDGWYIEVSCEELSEEEIYTVRRRVEEAWLEAFAWIEGERRRSTMPLTEEEGY
jgi:hypothetical protein